MLRSFARSWLLCAPLFALSALAPDVIAATAAGTISNAEGAAEITRAGTTEPEVVAERMEVRERDLLETGEDGLIELALADGSTLTLAPNTKLTVTKALYDSEKKDRLSLFDLLRGAVRAKVAALVGAARSEFDVQTPTVAAGVRGTEYEVEYDSESDESGVYLYEGSTEVKDTVTGEAVVLKPGHFIRHRRGKGLLAQILDEAARRRRLRRFIISERAKRRALRRIERREERREHREERREERQERREERREDRQERRDERKDAVKERIEERQERREERIEHRQERRENRRERLRE